MRWNGAHVVPYLGACRSLIGTIRTFGMSTSQRGFVVFKSQQRCWVLVPVSGCQPLHPGTERYSMSATGT
jgi:hypothetical protein